MKETSNKHLRPRRVIALLVTLFATVMSAWSLPLAVSDEKVDKEEEGTQALVVYLDKMGYDEMGGYCYFTFNTNVEGATVYYSIDGGEERTFEPGSGYIDAPKAPRRLTMPRNFRIIKKDKGEVIEGGDMPIELPDGQLAIAVGSTLTYYAKAEGYADSPVVTVTARAPFWSKLSGLWYESLNYDSEAGEPVTLNGKETVKGLYQMLVGKMMVSEHLLTPDENIDENFLYNYNGLVSGTDRTYAVADTQKGQVLLVYLYAEDGGSVTPLQGLEYDSWNSQVNEGEAWKYYAFEVTSDGVVQFSVSAGAYLNGVELMGELPPDMPYFSLIGVGGAYRTYEIEKPYNATTLYYTTAIADEAPAPGSTAWTSTTDNYVTVTVSGVGHLYAYAENGAGLSDIAEQYVNGVVQTLASPSISSKWYDGTNGVWQVDLQAPQYNLEGYADVAIYYSIDGGEAVAYTGTFSIANGSTLSCFARAENFNDSPTVTMTASPDLSLQSVWYEGYTYYYSSGSITAGEEVALGFYQTMLNGNILKSGHLLTSNENLDGNLQMTYRDGIRTYTDRTLAVANLKAGQYLYIYKSGGTVTAGTNTEADLWHSTSDLAILRVVADGTAQFTLSANGYLRQMYLYQEPEYGNVTVADANGNMLTYYYENATSAVTLTGISSYAENEAKAGRIIIHDEVTDTKGNTHEVKYIGGSLSNRDNLVSVVFGQNIVATGGADGTSDYAFGSCKKLESVTLNSKLETLGDYTFYQCEKLTAINLGAAPNLKTIGEYCFAYSGLTALDIPATVETLGRYMMYNCTKLASVTFASGSQLTAIPTYCFYYNTALTSLTLPDGIQTIGNAAFYGCTGLTELTFGPNLAANGFGTNYSVFYNCNNLNKMTVPGLNFPFATNYSGLPATLTIFVDASMVDTYKANSYTKNYHIVAIGSTTEFAVTTTTDSRLPIELAKLTDTPSDVIELTITGPINGTDINFIHQAMPFLQVLNLKDAQIVAGGDQYARWRVSGNTVTQDGSTTYSTQNDIVGPYMFANMPTLNRISLPDGATDMGTYALAWNYKMAQCVLPSQLKTIGDYAFYMYNNHGALKQIELPQSLTAIGKNAFRYTALTSITIPEGITLLDVNAFYQCSELAEVTLPSTLTTIGDYALAECSNLTTIELPDAVTTIGNNAFSRCSKLTAVNMPAQLVTIGSYAFASDSKLTSELTFPATCQTIGASAFDNCSGLTKVTFNEGLKSIGNSAFTYCRKLKEVSLPESLTSLGEYAFSRIDSLKTFTFPANIKKVPAGVLYYCKGLQSVTLAEGTTSIGNSAFYACSKLTDINFDQPQLTTIESSAFGNTGLVHVTLPDQITSMGSDVFENCSNLESINVPTGITTVPSYFCNGCTKLTQVTMHDGIRVIGSSAFSSCSSLSTIELNNQITTIQSNAFENCTTLKFTALPEALTTIGSYAFRSTKGMKVNLTLPSGLKTLDYNAFYESGLKGVVLPEGITSMGTQVFGFCDSLSSVVLPSDMKSIPSYTFYYDKTLKNIELPTALETIGNYAFQNSGLTSIHLPMSLLSIGYNAFANTNLTEFNVPKNVTTVSSQVASNCKHLKSARLGRKMSYTNNSYFDYFTGCDSLELLRVYAGTPPAIRGTSNYTSYRTNCVLEVPEGQVAVYQETDIWKEFKEIRAFSSDDMLNDIDFAVMRELYNKLDGAHWTKTWDISSQSYSNGKWYGITTVADSEDEELFYITAIDLSNQGLKGQLPKSLFNLPRLSTLNLSNNEIEAHVDTLTAVSNTTLTSVNLMGNHLKGDLYAFASKLPNLTYLNVSYNWLTDISEAWPHDILDNGQLYRGYQFIDYKTKQVVVPEDLMEQVVIDITPGIAADIRPTNFQTYRHEYGDFKLSSSYLYRLSRSGSSLYTESDGLRRNSEGLWDVNPNYEFRAPKGEVVAFTNTQPYHSYITYIFRFDWQDGDVNGDQTVDVSDLQGVVYYALNDVKPGGQLFNYTTADANADQKVNVTDMVITVDRIMAYEVPAGARGEQTAGGVRNIIDIAAGGTVVLAAQDEVAALQLTISGATARELAIDGNVKSRFKVAMRDVDGGVKVIIYSPMGQTLTAGTHQLLSGMPAGAAISDVHLTDSEARPLGVMIAATTTSIDGIGLPSLQPDGVYDLQGRRMGDWDTLPKGIYIINVNGKQYKVKK